MITRHWLAAAALAAVFTYPLAAQTPGPSSTPEITGVVTAGTPIELVQEGFVFTEGPVPTKDGGLYFTDTQAKPTKIFRLEPDRTVRVFRDDSNGVNGLALNKRAELFGAEMFGKRIVQFGQDGSVRATLVATTPEQPITQPNDLIFDAKGGLYFTDPGTFDPKNKDVTRVFYLNPQRKLFVVTDRIPLPNGLTLTPNGKMLIVDNTAGEELFAYDIQRDGTTANERVFGRLVRMAPGRGSGADGMTVDSAGRVYVTTSMGVQVLSPAGMHLGVIALPRTPANVAFGGKDRKTLFVAARQGIYQIRMLAQGVSRPGK